MRHSYHLQYSLEVMFKRSWGTFSKVLRRFPNELERNKLKENYLHRIQLGITRGLSLPSQMRGYLPSACT